MITKQERREAYIKAYVEATLSPTEKENWRTVRQQRATAARVYDRECRWGDKIILRGNILIDNRE